MNKKLNIIAAIILFVVIVIFVIVYWWKYKFYSVTLSASNASVLPGSMVDEYSHTFIWESTIFTTGPVGYMYEKSIATGAAQQLALLIMFNTQNFLGAVVPYAAGVPTVPVPVSNACDKLAFLGGIINFGSTTYAPMIADIGIFSATEIYNTAGVGLLLGAPLPAAT